jgi:hypothetical protein
LDVLATADRFFPITGLKSYIGFLFFVFSSLNPFKGNDAFEYIGRSGVIRIGSKCSRNSFERAFLSAVGLYAHRR